MKKFKDFILSFILPRKMYRHHNMKFIYALFIFILSAFIILFSVNLSVKRFMRKNIGSPRFEEIQYEKTASVTFPKYKIVKSENGGYYLDCDEPGTDGVDSYHNVVHTQLVGKRQNQKKILDVTTVFIEDMDLFKSDGTEIVTIDQSIFHLENYLNQPVQDNYEYVLYIFTKKAFYYCYNLGKVKNANGNLVDAPTYQYAYQYDDSGAYRYFLPKDSSELVYDETYQTWDITLWSVETAEGEVATLQDANGQSVTVTSSRKHQENLRYALRGGEYIYNNIVDIDELGKSDAVINLGGNSNLPEVLAELYEVMVVADAQIQKSMYGLIAMIVNVLVPLLWVLITWLMSRHFAMNKFREYYAICAVTYLSTSIIGFILGFFIEFTKLMLIVLIIELIYYIFVTFRINTDPALLDQDQNAKDDDKHPPMDQPAIQKPKLKFKEIKSDDAYQVE